MFLNTVRGLVISEAVCGITEAQSVSLMCVCADRRGGARRADVPLQSQGLHHHLRPLHLHLLFCLLHPGARAQQAGITILMALTRCQALLYDSGA